MTNIITLYPNHPIRYPWPIDNLKAMQRDLGQYIREGRANYAELKAAQAFQGFMDSLEQTVSEARHG